MNRLVGTKLSVFEEHQKGPDRIRLQPARLITTYKTGDEMALTSIFLSALRLVKEFKHDFFLDAKLTNSGKIYVYTEAVFPDAEDCRVDGLILIVKGGVIKDAALLEMKNKNCSLNPDQIAKYLQIAKTWKIPKLITVSNEFVSEPTQSPISVRVPKGVTLYHFSWSYILTIAHLLLFKNDNNIEDEDQVEIMREVVVYLENRISGVCGFTQMKPGWKNVAEKVKTGTHLRLTDPDVVEAVTSWQQEERDLALILSRNLGVMVRNNRPKFRGDLRARLRHDAKALMEDNELKSQLKVKGAVSDVDLTVSFRSRTIEMSARINTPLDKGLKGQIGWVARQIERCGKKNPEIFEKLSREIYVDIDIKHGRKNIRIPYAELSSAHEDIKGKEINGFAIVQVRYLGSKFGSPQKFVTNIEGMLVDYYRVVAQNLTRWEKPAPKVAEVVISPPDPILSGTEVVTDCSSETSI
jgi:hypothetical protein